MAGLVVDIAGDGQEAINRVLAQTYDLVLMDMQMPRVDGLEATCRIREIEELSALPIIAMTANVMQEDQARCRAVGMNDFIAKPFVPEELYAKLQHWLKIAAVAEEATVPAKATTTTGASSLVASIEGVNLAKGLRFTGNDPKRYARILERFLESQRGVPLQIRQALLEGKRQDAERLAHTLKGLAAQIAAEDLTSDTSSLEAAIRQSGEAEGTVFFLRKVELQLQRLCRAIEGGLSQVHRDDAGQAVNDPMWREQLMTLIDNDDAKAAHFVETHATTIARHFRPDEFQALNCAVRAFDFELAKALLEAHQSGGQQ